MLPAGSTQLKPDGLAPLRRYRPTHFRAELQLMTRALTL
jgi:hypothetical protein